MALPILPIAAFGLVLLASGTAQARRRRDETPWLPPAPPEIPPGMACTALGSVQSGGAGDCIYPPPEPGTYVDLNYAYGVDQGHDPEVWRWVGAYRLSPGQRVLLHAFDMAYGTEFLRQRPARWGDLEWSVLTSTQLHPNNQALWPSREGPPEWRWRRLQNMDVDSGWRPFPDGVDPQVRGNGYTSLPVVYMPAVEELL